jgi:hypothetical protein
MEDDPEARGLSQSRAQNPGSNFACGAAMPQPEFLDLSAIIPMVVFLIWAVLGD